MSTNPISDFNLQADYGDLIKSRACRYNPEASGEVIQRSIDLRRNVEGDDCLKPDPSKPLPEEYAMASWAYYGGKNGRPIPVGPPVIAVLMDCIGCVAREAYIGLQTAH